MEEHSLAWELVKFLKKLIICLVIFCVLELATIAYI